MSTTISYKGGTLGTVENESKKLNTKGTWLEDDITITDSSSGGGSVVVVDTPDSHGGTIREITAASVVSLHNTSTITPTESAQTIIPLSGYSGFRSVTVEAIPSAYVIPSGSLSITENGTYNVEAFAQAEVLVPTYSLASLTASENGTYNPSSGYAFNSVIVNVAGGSGITIDDIASHIISGIISGDTTVIGSYAFYGCSLITGASFSNVTTIKDYAFFECSSMSQISFPACVSVGSSAFTKCNGLIEAAFPACTSLGSFAFNSLQSLEKIYFPVLTTLTSASGAFNYNGKLSDISLPICRAFGSNAFYSDPAITHVHLPYGVNFYTRAFGACSNLHTIILGEESTGNTTRVFYSSVFQSCYRLMSVYLLGTSMFKLSVANVFNSTPISTYTTYTGGVNGSVFVHASLYDTYISATNWAIYSARIVSLTDTEVQNVITYGRHDP